MVDEVAVADGGFSMMSSLRYASRWKGGWTEGCTSTWNRNRTHAGIKKRTNQSSLTRNDSLNPGPFFRFQPSFFLLVLRIRQVDVEKVVSCRMMSSSGEVLT